MIGSDCSFAKDLILKHNVSTFRPSSGLQNNNNHAGSTYSKQ